jgi:hypothetical protein
MRRTPYHGWVLRIADRRVAAVPAPPVRTPPVGPLPVLTGLALLAVLVVAAGCGAPPEPALTAPPTPGGASLSSSGPALPPLGLPTVLPTPTTTAAFPPLGLPTATYPTYPTYPTRTTTRPTTFPTTSPATPGPTPAPKCTNGPSAQQVITVVKPRPGIPDRELKVVDGPFCAGTWQYSVLEIVATGSEDDYEPLLAVTNGTPAQLKAIEAGTDVCSRKVQNEAPPGVRVRACGN